MPDSFETSKSIRKKSFITNWRMSFLKIYQQLMCLLVGKLLARSRPRQGSPLVIEERPDPGVRDWVR